MTGEADGIVDDSADVEEGVEANDTPVEATGVAADDAEGTDADVEETDSMDGEVTSTGVDGEDVEAPNSRSNPSDDEDVELGNDTVPQVTLELYEVSVHVSGRSDDDLRTVEGTARRLMDYLIERTQELEVHPDDRGLG